MKQDSLSTRLYCGKGVMRPSDYVGYLVSNPTLVVTRLISVNVFVPNALKAIPKRFENYFREFYIVQIRI